MAWRGSRTAGLADPHTCQWRHLAYASLPITEESPDASTLMIEGCCLCAPPCPRGSSPGAGFQTRSASWFGWAAWRPPPPRFQRSPLRERPVDAREPLPPADAEASAPALTVNAELMAGR